MKKTLYLFSISLVIWACTPGGTGDIPTDLAGKKALLEQKKTELRNLQNSIQQLEAEIISEDGNPTEAKKRLVTISPVVAKDFESFVEIQGAVRAYKSVNASSELGGRILSLTVDEGDRVSRGQLIARTDTEAIDKSIQELNTSLELAEDLYQRQKNLWDQNIGTEVQYLQAKNQVDQLNKKLETLAVQKTKANSYAPLSGTVEMVFLKEGELAGPGTPIVQILNLSQVKVVADVSENYLVHVKEGGIVKITVPALNIEKEARVSMIGRTINAANRTFQVEVSMPNPGERLKPNLLATMFIKDSDEKNAITLPSILIQQDINGESYVYVRQMEDGQEIARQVYVQTGKSNLGETHILSGLNAGEEVIVKGARELVDGERIEVIPSVPSDTSELKMDNKTSGLTKNQ